MPATHDFLTSTSPAHQWEAWVRDWFTVLRQTPREGLTASASGATTNSVAAARQGMAAATPGASLPTAIGTGVDVTGHTPHALIFAPHPDDECIVGALPLRLRQEAGWRVTNVAVTLGSRLDRRAERLAELTAACGVLDFELRLLSEDGFEQVKPEAADARTPLWEQQVAQVADLLRAERPGLILVPHAGDGIPTHIGVHRLVSDALRVARLSTVVAWTEFWATQESPNALIETGVTDTARLVRALACHHGEIARNPYHLRLPAWMADNVRRGGELLAGAGETPPPFGFATLYRLSRWVDGEPVSDLAPTLAACEVPLSFETLGGGDLVSGTVAHHTSA